MNRKQLALRLSAIPAVVLATAGSAHAAVDVTAITAAGADVALVGGAVFAVIIGIKVWKWIRGAA